MWNEAKHIAELEKIYKKAMLDVMNTLINKETKGRSTLFYKNQLKDLMGILGKLDNDYLKWINDNVPKAYDSARFSAQTYINKVLEHDKYPHAEFSKVHQRSVDILTQNLTDNLRNANQFVGRQIQDAFRTEQLRQTVSKVAAGKTVNEMAKEMAESLRSQGIVCFKDKMGRNWSLETYSKMCARTVTRQAATTATINTCNEADVNLVQISTHSGACKLCQSIQGKIYILSGKSIEYDKYGVNNVIIPRHPNCAHVIMPYIKELNKNNDAIEKVKSYLKDADTSNRERLAKHILNKSGLSGVDFNIIPIQEKGYCEMSEFNGKININSYNLQENDDRNHKYQVKTVFHEFYHANVNGLKSDISVIGFNDWKRIEETFTECAAHSMMKIVGIDYEIAPSYSNHLVENLPKLKKLDEFKECNTISDFGDIALKFRFSDNERLAEWDAYLQHCNNTNINMTKYAKQYEEYIFKNMDNLVEKFIENVPVFSGYEYELKEDLESAWDKVNNNNINNLDRNEKLSFYNTLILAMNKEGIK